MTDDTSDASTAEASPPAEAPPQAETPSEPVPEPIVAQEPTLTPETPAETPEIPVAEPATAPPPPTSTPTTTLSPSSPQQDEVPADTPRAPETMGTEHPARPDVLPASELAARGLAARRSRAQAKLDKILAFAAGKEFITNDDVEKLLHVSNATATRYLNKLVIQGKLRRIGNESHAKYTLLK